MVPLCDRIAVRTRSTYLIDQQGGGPTYDTSPSTVMAAGYIAACCVAASVIVMALLLFSTSQTPFVLDLALVRATTLLAGLVAGFVAVLALIPFLIAVAFAERNAITSPIWYVVAGAVAGVVALGLNLLLTAPRGGIRLSDLSDHPAFESFSIVVMVVAMAGSCAGYAYWLIAARPKRTISN